MKRGSKYKKSKHVRKAATLEDEAAEAAVTTVKDQSSEDEKPKWGKSLDDYYVGSDGSAHENDLDDEALTDGENSDLEGAEKEAFNLLQRRAEALDKLDFAAEAEQLLQNTLDTGKSHDNNVISEKVSLGATAADLAAQLEPLLRELENKGVQLCTKLVPLLQDVKMREQFTAEVSGDNVENHPVIERLIETKLLLNKLKPIEVKLQPKLKSMLEKSTSEVLRPNVDFF